MCFSKESSFLSWGVSSAIAGYLLFRRRGYDVWNAAFIISFSTIQLLEGLVWWGKVSDELLTGLILLTLLSQPLVQSFMGSLYTKGGVSKFLGLMAVVYALIILEKVAVGSLRSGKTEVGEQGHLVWNFGGSGIGYASIPYLMGILLPLFFQKDGKGLPLVLVGVLTFSYSMMKAKTREFGSFWCFTAVVYSLLALFL
jgi:hypothetical protein